ncbi:MAG: cobalamin-binding protein [Rhodobacterales bacterium 34-62-10]|nr:MAG: cobalamin-binding protein [Rhodobacterales bacterium 34-62-10]
MTLVERCVIPDLSPQRIVCLTEETVETLYLLGQQDRIVGVTGYAIRPPQVRREKPRVGAFTSADIPKILELRPDLVLTFSDLQADIVAQLIRAGVAVHAFNQRDIHGIFRMIRTLGALTSVAERAETLIASYAERIDALRLATPNIRMRIYFEEWDVPMISGIRWASELIGVAGGVDVFENLSYAPAAKDRIVTSEQVIAAAPDVIIGSWCGKKLRPEKIAARPGWHEIPAVKNGHIFEIKSPLILQPGPAALGDGLDAICAIVAAVKEDRS